jgi:hypothetical protein
MNSQYHDLADQVSSTTEAVESEKERKQTERLLKQEEKRQQARMQVLEKLVAPALLILTVLTSLLLWLIYN